MLIGICILVWSAVCLLVVGVTMRGEREIIESRIKLLQLVWEEDAEKIVPELVQPFKQRVFVAAMRKTMVTLSKLLPPSTSAIAKKLDQAGNPFKLQALEFIGLKAFSLIIFLGGAGAFVYLVEVPFLHKVVGVACALLMGYAIPDTLLEQAIRERHTSICRSLPNSLDLLVVTAEAGLGFDAAIVKLVERTEEPLTQEFRKMLGDMAIGRSRADALKAMADRVNLPELTLFVAAIRQADMLGTSIAAVLRVQADSMRSKRNLRAREAAAKLPVKMLFPLIFCIFPSIFAVILAPGVLSMLKAFK